MHKTAKRLIVFGLAWIALAGGSCDPTSSGTVTERARCEAWASTLFLPSRSDTEETAIALNAQIAIFRAACPGIEPEGI